MNEANLAAVFVRSLLNVFQIDRRHAKSDLAVIFILAAISLGMFQVREPKTNVAESADDSEPEADEEDGWFR